MCNTWIGASEVFLFSTSQLEMPGSFRFELETGRLKSTPLGVFPYFRGYLELFLEAEELFPEKKNLSIILAFIRGGLQ